MEPSDAFRLVAIGLALAALFGWALGTFGAFPTKADRLTECMGSGFSPAQCEYLDNRNRGE